MDATPPAGADQPLTSLQAFEAMRVFLAQFNEREPPGRRQTIEFLLQWTLVEPDGLTADPAQWDDWTAAVASVLGDEPPDQGI